MKTRRAVPGDAPALAEIYNEGIADRIATFETTPRSDGDISMWFDRPHPIVVVEDASGVIVAFANITSYKSRGCYDGIGEYSVYVRRSARGQGAGRVAMGALIQAAREADYWKLVARIFPENTKSLELMKSLGFREVGVYKHHAKLDGIWRDCVIVELVIEENLK